MIYLVVFACLLGWADFAAIPWWVWLLCFLLDSGSVSTTTVRRRR